MVFSRAFQLFATAFCFSTATSFAVDYFLFNSSFPHEHFDSVGSQTANGYGPTTPVNVKAISSRDFQTPFVFLTRSSNELYLIGGMAPPATNYISKADPLTLAELKRTSIDCPDTACPFKEVWAPSAAMHSNGFIYIVNESRIWKLDNNINILASYDLPLKDGAYNSLKILSDGNIVVKGMGNTGGTQDYSTLTVVDPNLQPVIADYRTPEKVYGRFTTLVRNNVEHIYLPGEATAMRIRYVGGSNPSLTLDSTWLYKYRELTDTAIGPGGILTFIGDNAYFLDNCVPTKSNGGPISLYRLSLNNIADSQKVTPWPNTTGGFHFNKHVADPSTGVLIAADDPNKKMAGYRYAGNNQMVKLWELDIQSKVIASASNGRLYTTELTSKGENLLIIDIVTGQILSRTRNVAPGASVGVITVGYNNDIFYPGPLNYSVRITDRR